MLPQAQVSVLGFCLLGLLGWDPLLGTGYSPIQTLPHNREFVVCARYQQSNKQSNFDRIHSVSFFLAVPFTRNSLLRSQAIESLKLLPVRDDFASLRVDKEWVHDAVMASFSNLCARARPEVSMGTSFALVNPMTRLSLFHPVNFSSRMVLFPVHHANHWTLLRLVNQGTTFYVTLFDSFEFEIPKAVLDLEIVLRAYFTNCALNAKFFARSRCGFSQARCSELALNATVTLVRAAIPQQQDDFTCGFRVMHYMEWVVCTLDENVATFDHPNDPSFWSDYRLWVAHSIVVDHVIWIQPPHEEE